MTANGWLQITLFLVLIFLVTKPLGRLHGAGVQP